MDRTNFENLEVYLLSEQLADLIWEVVIKWEGFARNTVGRQLVRSADSVGANIAEGAGRGAFQDSRRFVKIARGSLYETKHWLRRAFKRRLLTDEQVDMLRPAVDELVPRLNAYLNSIGREPQDRSVTDNQPRTTDNDLPATDDEQRTTDQTP